MIVIVIVIIAAITTADPLYSSLNGMEKLLIALGRKEQFCFEFSSEAAI